MKLKVSESEWQEILQQYRSADEELGSEFAQLTQDFLEEMEEYLGLGYTMEQSKDLVIEEQVKLHSSFALMDIVEVLVVAGTFWERGDELLDSLSPLESFAFSTAIAHKVLAQSEMAALQEPGE